MAHSRHLFTSESVTEGHPDKIADQISDAVLDAILSQDKSARVAAETLVKDNLVVLAGEITTRAHVNYDEVARETIKRIGYTDPKIGFDTHTCTVLVAYGQQSPNIAQGVDESKAVYMPVKTGQFSMHHERTWHASSPNPSTRRRVGIAFFYINIDGNNVRSDMPTKYQIATQAFI